MLRILVTGMSGTGKSSALEGLRSRGYVTVDTDTDEWSQWETLADGTLDWIWNETAMGSLLTMPHETPLFVAGCKTNQGGFYPFFDHIVLLSAPVEVLLERVAKRTNNSYGKSLHERQQIIDYVETVEPRLRRSATMEIDASAPLAAVVDQLARLASNG
jgi:dephospho-CoA kinase